VADKRDLAGSSPDHEALAFLPLPNSTRAIRLRWRESSIATVVLPPKVGAMLVSFERWKSHFNPEVCYCS